MEENSSSLIIQLIWPQKISWNINEIKQSNRIQGRKIMYLFKLVEENVIDFCDALFKEKILDTTFFKTLSKWILNI